MSFDEDAEMHYAPASGDVHMARATAEAQLMSRVDVHGIGITKTSTGQDAIVVYVADQDALTRLPKDIDGCEVIGEVTGEIRPQ